MAAMSVWWLTLLLCTGGSAMHDFSHADVLALANEEFPNFLEVGPDNQAFESFQDILADGNFTSLQDLPSQMMPEGDEIPQASCLMDKPTAQLKTELYQEVLDSKNGCFQTAAAERDKCVAALQCTNNVTVKDQQKECQKIEINEDCAFLSDDKKKADCETFAKYKLTECMEKLNATKDKIAAEEVRCTKGKEACEKTLAETKVLCTRRAIVEKSIAVVRADAAQMVDTIDKKNPQGRINITEQEFEHLIATPDFTAAVDAAKACAGKNEFYYGLVAKTMAKLVTDWKVLRAEFAEKRRGVASLNMAEYDSKCLTKEFAAISTLADFNSKTGFLKTLGYACDSSCRWDGEDCVDKKKDVTLDMQKSMDAYHKCYAELVEAGLGAKMGQNAMVEKRADKQSMTEEMGKIQNSLKEKGGRLS